LIVVFEIEPQNQRIVKESGVPFSGKETSLDSRFELVYGFAAALPVGLPRRGSLFA
jgi:hypothetical protein